MQGFRVQGLGVQGFRVQGLGGLGLGFGTLVNFSYIPAELHNSRRCWARKNPNP